MEKFIYYQDEKLTIWRRSSFSVEASSKEEADDVVRNLKGENVFNLVDADNIETLESMFLFETEEEMSPEDNDGQSTIEYCDKDGSVLSCNGKE